MEFTLKRNTKKSIAIITAMAIILTLLMPMGGAFASLSNSWAETVPRVTDGDNKKLGVLAIELDRGTVGGGHTFSIYLPEGVEFATTPKEVAVTKGIEKGVFTDEMPVLGNDAGWKIANAGDDFIEIKRTGGASPPKNRPVIIRVQFTVDIDDDVTGDIIVRIDGANTGITSESVTVARVVVGKTTTTISEVEDLAIDSTGLVGDIRIRENVAGALDVEGDVIELILPDGFKWDLDAKEEKEDAKDTEEPPNFIFAVGGSVTAHVYDDRNYDPDEVLEIIVTASKRDSRDIIMAGNITIENIRIIVPEDAALGDVEMTIEGNEVTEEDIVIAKVGDFGFEVETKGDIPTIVAGKVGKEIADIVIEETAPNSWDNGRSVIMEMPGWAEWHEEEPHGADGPLGKGVRDEDDREEARWNVADEDESKAELENMEVSIDADAPAGDLTVEIRGRAGVTGELVVAEIVRPFEVTAEKHEMAIGVRGQTVGDITITETQAEAICENKWVIIKAPRGFEFEDFDVEVTDGDMKIDDDETEGRYLAFRIDRDSNREASTIKITGMEFDVDRHIPEGDVNFEIFMTKSSKIDKIGNFDHVIDDANYEDVTSVVVATVTTPAPLAVSSTVFTIGSAIFNVDGVMRAMDVAPYVKDGRTFLPVRFVAQAVGVADDDIDWNAETHTVTLTEGDTVVELVIGSKTITIDGASEVMDVAPELTAGRTMLPARAVAVAFGFKVGWDEATRAVVISN
ncbi:copper amine oxidase N-terminal domain-containing protein [Peptococcaceae bacterium]|nr:copper amine oxidase N-terminal domain-containing protein [Peptococcaceae bacterium]